MALHDEILELQAGVATREQLLIAGMTRHAINWKVDTDRWQRPFPGVVIAHSGKIGQRELEWAALLWAGRGAALAGPTAAALDGLKGYESECIYLVIPSGRRVSVPRGEPRLVVARSRALGPLHIHPVAVPRRTRITRSLVETAALRRRPEDAFAVLAAGVQQRLVSPSGLCEVIDELRRLRHKDAMLRGLEDVAGGVQSLPERSFLRIVEAAGLPRPDSQAVRIHEGRRRYLDFYWSQWRLAAEIDGLSHLSVDRWIDDMTRSNELVVDGDAVLRFPAVVVRLQPRVVSDVLTRAFASRGWVRGSLVRS